VGRDTARNRDFRAPRSRNHGKLDPGGLRPTRNTAIMRSVESPALRVRRLTGALGAEIDGVDVAGPLTPRTVAELQAAFLEHHVLVFRGQSLTHEDQVRFARCFGETQVHPFVEPSPHHPEVIELITEADEAFTFSGGWHTDLTCLDAPVLGSVLYGVELPPFGGDTLFANQHLAYEALSAPMRKMLDGLGAAHSAGAQYAAGGSATSHASMPTQNSELAMTRVVHPIVRTHPESNRKGLFINEAYTTEIEGVSPDESFALLSFLFRHAVSERFTCRVSWEPGTLVMWDNRSVQHQGVQDYVGYRRHMRRVTVQGDRPA
jgi:taurine dioxygenase